MAFVEDALVIGEHGHGADGVVVSDQRNTAEAALGHNRLDAEVFDFLHEILADENGLACSNQILGEVVSRGPSAFGNSTTAEDFEVKANFIAERIELGNIEVFYVEEAAQLLPDFFGEIFFVQGGAERAADFVEHVQLFGATRGLLDQVAVLDSHADLMAKRHQEAQFWGGETPVVRGAEKQDAESLLLGLETDGHDAAQTLCKSKLPETADGFFSVERGKGIVAQITKSEQAAEAGDEADEIVVQFFVLRRAAELITKADSHHRGG